MLSTSLAFPYFFHIASLSFIIHSRIVDMYHQCNMSSIITQSIVLKNMISIQIIPVYHYSIPTRAQRKGQFEEGERSKYTLHCRLQFRNFALYRFSSLAGTPNSPSAATVLTRSTSRVSGEGEDGMGWPKRREPAAAGGGRGGAASTGGGGGGATLCARR